MKWFQSLSNSEINWLLLLVFEVSIFAAIYLASNSEKPFCPN